VGSYTREEGEHSPPLVADHVSGNKVFVYEDLLAVVNWISESDVLLEGSCCCMHPCFSHPGN
jgi:hypothetical protein